MKIMLMNSSSLLATLLDFCFKKRWTIGALLLLLCVLLKLHGSSIGLYAEFTGHPELNDVLFGKNRLIRSDEWLVFTPFAFSQYYTGFSFISDIVRGTATNMFITYGQAVWDPAMIYRPTQWGYLFLPPGCGLSFFWMSRLIILFLVSFEFSLRIIAKDDKAIAVCYAAMIAFAPLVQWWFSVNSIAEILIAGQGMVILWKFYLSEKSALRRRLYGAAMLWCIGIYILALYPAWQVSFGYVFLLAMIWTTYQEKTNLYLLRHDYAFWAIGILAMSAPIVHVIANSLDMIKLTMATEYPGKRFELGGNWTSWAPAFSWFFIYGAGLFLPFEDVPIINNCELASFFTLSPLCFIPLIYLTWKRKLDGLLALFALGFSLFTVWTFLGLPPWLAKISMLSNVTLNRSRSAAEFLNVLMLCRGAYLMKLYGTFPSKAFKLLTAILTGILPVFCIWYLMPQWMPPVRIVIGLSAITLSSLIFLSSPRRLGAAFMVILMLCMGATVNPLAKGANSIYVQPVGQKISELTAVDKSSLWLSEIFALNDFPIMFGAPTINSVNVYPALSRWEQLDGGKNREIYNRYAHITVQLINETTPSSFELKSADHFQVTLRPSDLRKLGVKYILSRNDLERLSTNDVHICKIFEDHGIFIYKADYSTP